MSKFPAIPVTFEEFVSFLRSNPARKIDMNQSCWPLDNKEQCGCLMYEFAISKAIRRPCCTMEEISGTDGITYELDQKCKNLVFLCLASPLGSISTCQDALKIVDECFNLIN